MVDDTRNAIRHGHHAKSNRIPADGIIGRLTYTPAVDNQPLGQIRRNRAKDETPRFKQVTPFEQWCPSPKTATPPSDMGPFQVARSQRNWLLEHHPEASFLDEDISSLLLEEIAASQAERGPAPAETAPLFSVGEVADLRRGKLFKGHPVLAVASGVSGNVLRMISLGQEEWVWNEADIRVRLHVPDINITGECCRDAVPISLIKFAVDSRKPDPIRWLIVSNGASTTVYEPELRMIPMPTTTTARVLGSTAASQFFVNPLFTIPCDRTGPGFQADVCFVRHGEGDIPQLVIVDKTGCWSLWNITGRRNARPRKLTPVLKMRGTSVSGCVAKLPLTSMAEPEPHKVFWLSFKPPQVSRGSKKKRSSQSHAEADGQPRRLLLLCSPKAIRLILGAAPSRLDAGQAFVLTSTSLFWVSVCEGKKGQLALDVLASCPHQKDVNDPTVRMDVSPGAYIRGQKACFVAVRSARDTEMAIFWFIQPEQSAPVRYHREVISLKSPSNFVSMHVMPAGRRIGNEPTSPAGRALHKAGLRFFQILTLGQDLAVHGALCAWSDEPGLVIPPPDLRERLTSHTKWRLKLLQSLTDAFAVPDEFDESVVFGKHGIGSLELERLEGGKQQRVDLGLVAQRLIGDMDLEAGEEWGGSPRYVDFDFLEKAVEWRKEDGYMPRHSLLDLAAEHPKDRLFELARAWDAQQDVLHRNATDWSFVPEARRLLVDFGPDDLLDKLKDLFLGSQSGDAPYQASREEVLRTMAAEMFLSNIGVSSLPQSWTNTETDTQSSLPFPSSPSIMPSSQLQLLSSAKGKGKAKDQPDEEAGGDATVLRLRKYATLDPSPTIHGETVVALSRWDLGADPDDIAWRPGQDLEAEDAINRRRRKWEARRRKAERLSQRIFGEDSLGSTAFSSSQSFGMPGSSMHQLPTILSTQPSSSSQGQGPGLHLSQSQSHSQPTALPWNLGSQQVLGTPVRGPFGTPRVRAPSPLRKEYRRDEGGGEESQETPSQAKSQVAPGLFGGRRSFSPFKRSVVKKGKRKSEVRLSGFR
ncbi:hypothetical protein VTJ49DRAFT_4352 [Mycothermus thermophilus]|uniref:RNA polymerase I-specific transcription initiation factor RRN6-like protein n=1 Tax=Humicola insolens TaxID=85995 RepID=A0ABR3V5K3_HUMIN